MSVTSSNLFALQKVKKIMTAKNHQKHCNPPLVSSQATNENATKGEGEETNLVAIGRKDLRFWNWHGMSCPTPWDPYMVDICGIRRYIWYIIYI